jgi:hypothetical protein
MTAPGQAESAQPGRGKRENKGEKTLKAIFGDGERSAAPREEKDTNHILLQDNDGRNGALRFGAGEGRRTNDILLQELDKHNGALRIGAGKGLSCESMA